ncbi:MAG: DUF697 domain-containing protein [Candidatus Parabeggiatoa sp.]|nr:DUF697 domain-containing protein [Candidatus Parabeggiatoa sp.]
MTESVLSVSELNTDKGEEQTVSSQPSTKQARTNRALKSVNKYVLLSGGVGLIPAPFFDQVVIAGLLAKMLSDLSQIYQVKLSNHKIKVIVASVLGGAHSSWITHYMANYLKFVPGINVMGRTIVSGAITYTIGRLFIRHFESGAWR